MIWQPYKETNIVDNAETTWFLEEDVMEPSLDVIIIHVVNTQKNTTKSSGIPYSTMWERTKIIKNIQNEQKPCGNDKFVWEPHDFRSSVF